MKTLTLVVNNRLNYLKRVIHTLRQNDCSEFTLFIGAEPTNKDVIAFCQNINFIPLNLTINKSPLGVRENPYQTLTRAFANGSKFNIALEDDVILAPDALRLANWYHNLVDHNSYLALCLMNYDSTKEHPETIVTSRHFSPLGWCTSLLMWERYVAPSWGIEPQGWDFSINTVLKRNSELLILQPRLSRSNHIGREGGTHCSPAHHDKIFAGLAVSDGTKTNYSIQK